MKKFSFLVCLFAAFTALQTFASDNIKSNENDEFNKLMGKIIKTFVRDAKITFISPVDEIGLLVQVDNKNWYLLEEKNRQVQLGEVIDFITYKDPDLGVNRMEFLKEKTLGNSIPVIKQIF